MESGLASYNLLKNTLVHFVICILTSISCYILFFFVAFHRIDTSISPDMTFV